MKYEYSLQINGGSGLNDSNHIVVTYGRTRDILLACASGRGLVRFAMTKNYADHFVGSYCADLVKETIKKVMLMHLMKYGRPLKIEQILLYITGKDFSSEINVMSLMQPNSMIARNLAYGSANILNDKAFIEQILQIQKSKQGSEVSSLYAYLYSKCQSVEIERFMYLWMSFNGFYGKKYHEKSDRAGIEKCLRAYHLGQEVFAREQRNTQCNLVMVYLSKLSEEELLSLDDEQSAASQGIRKYLTKKDGTALNITIRGFLTMDFPYFLRCSVFHASKPLPLFSFENDMETVAVKVAIRMLDSFMDQHILEILDV